MKVLREGHRYELSNFEHKEKSQVIQFIEKETTPDNELATILDGTTNEELLEVLINRMNYLDNKFPCRENMMAIVKLEEALMWLNKRTADRIKRNVEGKHIK